MLILNMVLIFLTLKIGSHLEIWISAHIPKYVTIGDNIIMELHCIIYKINKSIRCKIFVLEIKGVRTLKCS